MSVAANGCLGSVIIPAHNEAAVIGRCLEALFDGIEAPELDVIVVCNGCSDDTAGQVRAGGHHVRVLELPEGSKPAALRAGDAAAAHFPRLYLDADVVLPGPVARLLLQRLGEGAVAARPPIRYETDRASRLVRRYYRARTRIPAVLGSLWGAGVYGLSEAGRRRFDVFPDLVGDDLWVDRHFDRSEVDVLDCAPVLVAVPRRPRDLVAVLCRTYRGKCEPQPSTDVGERRTLNATLRDLLELLFRGPGAAVDATIYGAFAVAGRLALVMTPSGGLRWERDESSRAA